MDNTAAFDEDTEQFGSSRNPVTCNISTGNVSLGLNEREDTRLVMAATLINEVRFGRHGIFELEPRKVKLYNFYYTFYINYLIHIFVWFNLALAIFEKPAVSGYELPYWATMIMEFVCIFLFTLCLFHRWYIAPNGRFWRKKNTILTATIIITLLDMLLYSIFMENGLESIARRWSRILRPAFLINLQARQIRRAFRNIRRTIFGILNVLVLLLLAIGLFALLATKLFENRNLKDIDGNPYFQNYFESYYQLYILTTTANNPDIGIPAYDSNNWFGLFFVAFLVICMYIFLSILLAVVYTKYKKHLQDEMRRSIYQKRRHLKEAFDLICEELNECMVLTFDTWKSLLQVLCPKYSPGKVSLLWNVLDRENNDYTKLKDFVKVSELLNIRVIEVKEEVHLFEKICPAIYRSWLSVKIRGMVYHRYFRFFFDLVILANAILIVFSSLEIAEAVFLLLFNMELFFKFYTYGCREFFVNLWNTFDFIFIEGATVAFIVELSGVSVTASQSVYDFFIILRVLRLIKVIGAIERFNVIVNTVLQIGPTIAIYGGIVFIFFYMYAILGMELFQGRIRMLGYPNATANVTELFCGDVKLKNSGFYKDHYCGENFNDILKSLKMLFDLMVVNQWHILTQGFVMVTSKAARLYFVLFHLTCVILILNIFVAFIIEAFMLQYKCFHKKFNSELQKVLQKVIQENGVGIEITPITEQSRTEPTPSQPRAEAIAPRTQSQITLQEYAMNENIRYRVEENQIMSAENLLQQMFERVIGPEEFEVTEVELGRNNSTSTTVG